MVVVQDYAGAWTTGRGRCQRRVYSGSNGPPPTARSRPSGREGSLGTSSKPVLAASSSFWNACYREAPSHDRKERRSRPGRQHRAPSGRSTESAKRRQLLTGP